MILYSDDLLAIAQWEGSYAEGSRARYLRSSLLQLRLKQSSHLLSTPHLAKAVGLTGSTMITLSHLRSRMTKNLSLLTGDLL
jgi:hypothetical protein